MTKPKPHPPGCFCTDCLPVTGDVERLAELADQLRWARLLSRWMNKHRTKEYLN